MATAQDIPHLIKLLDDEQPEVRDQVTQILQGFGGDISAHIAGLGIDLVPAERQHLTKMLHPQRRETLRSDWQVPAHKLSGGHEDWETFEALLRLISDYLHDGISLRPSLSDELDLLAEEIREKLPAPSVDDVRHFLFVSERLTGNKGEYYAPENSDLSHTIEEGTGNPIGLAVIFLLVCQRLGLGMDVQPCSFPSHFLAKAVIDGEECLIDCFHGGRTISIKQLYADNSLNAEARRAIEFTASPGAVLRRILVNLAHAWSRHQQPEDELLALELAASLEPVGA